MSRPSFIGPFSDEGRALIERAEAQAEAERRKMYCVVYIVARMSLEKGQDPDAIRQELLNPPWRDEEDEDEEELQDDEYMEEIRAATVQNAVEDALAGNPSRYEKREDFLPENCGRFGGF